MPGYPTTELRFSLNSPSCTSFSTPVSWELRAGGEHGLDVGNRQGLGGGMEHLHERPANTIEGGEYGPLLSDGHVPDGVKHLDERLAGAIGLGGHGPCLRDMRVRPRPQAHHEDRQEHEACDGGRRREGAVTPPGLYP